MPATIAQHQPLCQVAIHFVKRIGSDLFHWVAALVRRIVYLISVCLVSIHFVQCVGSDLFHWVSRQLSDISCQIRQLSDRTTVRSDNCQIGQLSVGQLSVGHGQLSEKTVSALKKL